MIVYFLNLLIVTVFSMIAVKHSKKRYVFAIDKESNIPNLLFVWLIIFLMMSVYALRWYVGTDYGSYYGFYFYYGNTDIYDIIGIRDWGFFSIASIMFNIFPNNFIIYNYVLAGLTYIPVILILRKYSSDFTFSVILFITMMIFYIGFNGVRQAIALSICFYAYPLLYKKKYFLYSLFILFAYLFHSTALLLIPLMFVVTRKAWSKTIVLILILIIATITLLPNLWIYLVNFLDYIGQEKMANDYSDYKHSDDGINVMRILVATVPIIMSLLFYKKLKNNTPKIDILINMSLLYLVFLLFGLQMTVLARISMYFEIFNTLLIPELASVFKGNDKILFKVITIILFLTYMLLLLPVDSNLLPYKIILNK